MTAVVGRCAIETSERLEKGRGGGGGKFHTVAGVRSPNPSRLRRLEEVAGGLRGAKAETVFWHGCSRGCVPPSSQTPCSKEAQLASLVFFLRIN